MDKQIIIDCFGIHYKVVLSRTNRIPSCLKPKRLHDIQSTRQFIRGLRAPHGFWARLLHTTLVPQRPNGTSNSNWVNTTAWALLYNKIRLYEIQDPNIHRLQIDQRSFTGNQGIVYRFESATELLTTRPIKLKTFTSAQAAISFFDQLSIDGTRIIELIDSLPCISKFEHPQTDDYGALTKFLAEKLINGTIVVFVEKASQKTILSSSTEELIHSGSSLKPVPLAPPSEQVASSGKENATMDPGKKVAHNTAAIKADSPNDFHYPNSVQLSTTESPSQIQQIALKENEEELRKANIVSNNEKLDRLYGELGDPNLIKDFETKNYNPITGELGGGVVTNPDLKVWKAGETMTLDPGKNHIFSIDKNGNLATGTEVNVGAGPSVYHPDHLVLYDLGHPTITNGAPSRISGEIRYQNDRWIINGDSGRYTSPYTDRTQAQLDNAADLVRSLNFPVEVIPLPPKKAKYIIR